MQTDLQKTMTDVHNTRRWWQIASSLSPSARANFLRRCTLEEGPFHILDVGCGQGRAINEFLDSRQEPWPEKEFFGYGVDHSFKNYYEGNAQLVAGDATSLPFKDESIDFGYSYQTAMYIADTLRMFEEGYRVLKPGGAFCWEVHPHDIAANYVWDDIAAITAGSEIFRIEKTNNCFAQAIYVIKNEDDVFSGFPFVLEDIVKGEQLPDLKTVDLTRFPHLRYCERGVYAPKTI